MVTRKTRLASLSLSCLFVASLLGTGCGDGQSVDPGLPPTTDASASDAASDVPADSIPAINIKLTYGSSSMTVDLAPLPTQDYKGLQVVKLSDVWATGKLAPDLSKLVFDFEGDDGFRPSSKSSCTPVPGADLEKGYILPGSRTLFWDDSLGLPGCYRVKFVAVVIGLDAPTDAGADTSADAGPDADAGAGGG